MSRLTRLPLLFFALTLCSRIALAASEPAPPPAAPADPAEPGTREEGLVEKHRPAITLTLPESYFSVEAQQVLGGYIQPGTRLNLFFSKRVGGTASRWSVFCSGFVEGKIYGESYCGPLYDLFDGNLTIGAGAGLQTMSPGKSFPGRFGLFASGRLSRFSSWAQLELGGEPFYAGQVRYWVNPWLGLSAFVQKGDGLGLRVDFDPLSGSLLGPLDLWLAFTPLDLDRFYGDRLGVAGPPWLRAWGVLGIKLEWF